MAYVEMPPHKRCHQGIHEASTKRKLTFLEKFTAAKRFIVTYTKWILYKKKTRKQKENDTQRAGKRCCEKWTCTQIIFYKRIKIINIEKFQEWIFFHMADKG